MLIIYGKMQTGGIETFYLRLAKERARKNLSTKFLFLTDPIKSDPSLIQQLKMHSLIYFSSDIFCMHKIFEKLPLLAPLKNNVLSKILSDVTQVHIYDAYAGLFAQRIFQKMSLNIPISVGFYHYMKYLWGNNQIPLYEKINRKFIFEYLPSESLLFYSTDVKNLYQNYYSKKFEFSKDFRIGVIDLVEDIRKSRLSTNLKIISVGRLVKFKTYFIQTLFSLYKLKQDGYSFDFHIYGDGPVYEEISRTIKKLKLQENVKIYEPFSYNQFTDIVQQYDLFIGSGTSVIEASSLGIPSIIGIENNNEPTSYGYFSDVYQREYNLNFLNIKKYDIYYLIKNIIDIDNDDYLILSNNHIKASKNFSIEQCSSAIEHLSDEIKMKELFDYNKYQYEFSRLYNIFLERLGYKSSEEIFTAISDIKIYLD